MSKQHVKTQDCHLTHLTVNSLISSVTRPSYLSNICLTLLNNP